MLAKIGNSSDPCCLVEGMCGVVHGEGPSIRPAKGVGAVPGKGFQNPQRRLAQGQVLLLARLGLWLLAHAADAGDRASRQHARFTRPSAGLSRRKCRLVRLSKGECPRAPVAYRHPAGVGGAE